MNVVMDDAEEVWVKETKSKKLGSRNHLGTLPPALQAPPGNEPGPPPAHLADRQLLVSHPGRLLLKGENITLISPATAPQ